MLYGHVFQVCGERRFALSKTPIDESCYYWALDTISEIRSTLRVAQALEVEHP